MAMGLQAATEGFMRGSDWRQEHERNKKLDHILDMEVNTRDAFAGLQNPYMAMLKKQIAKYQQQQDMSALGDQVMGAENFDVGTPALDTELPSFADGGTLRRNFPATSEAVDRWNANADQILADLQSIDSPEKLGPAMRNAAVGPAIGAAEYASGAIQDTVSPYWRMAKAGLGIGDREQPPRRALAEEPSTPASAPPGKGTIAPAPMGGGGPRTRSPHAFPATGAAPTSGGKRSALPPAKVGPTSSAAPQASAVDLKSLPFSADDMPQMGAREWAEYRLALMQAAQKSGRPELVQQVNDSVTKMQHDGFMSYGQQALALLQAGDEDGAKKALVAAYSHFPNGTNVKFAVQGSQLVGYGVDEQTGKPKGAMAITPEMLDRTLRNFQNPQAFATWTVDRQNAMSQAKNADTNAYRAETDRTTGLGNLAVNQGELGVKRALLPSQILGNQAQAAYHTSQALYPKTGRSALGGDGEGGGLNDNDMRDFDQKANDMAYMIAMRSGDSEGRTVSEIKSVAAALYAREPMNPARALQRTEQIFALQGPAREQALRMVMGQQ